MYSKIGKLTGSDVVRGIATAVFTAIIVTIYGAVNQQGFNLFTADWSIILSDSFTAGFSAFIGYLSKNAVTDENGKMFGKI